MQRALIIRSLGVLAVAAAITACHPSVRSTAGQTPEPSSTTAQQAQANAHALPDQAITVGSGQKYMATTGKDLKDVRFSLWANGRPIGIIEWPSKSLDITKDLRGHANVLVVKWTRSKDDGKGTLTVKPQTGKPVATVNVTPSSPKTGQFSKTFYTPQAPIGRGRTGGGPM
jgi:hypothetical protein